MPGRPRSRSTFIVILLVATLALTGGLAYEAQQAARSHRATAENVLRDYSACAVWELTRLGRDRLLPIATTEGDVLLVADAGAYGMAMANTYNLRALPAQDVLA